MSSKYRATIKSANGNISKMFDTKEEAMIYIQTQIIANAKENGNLSPLDDFSEISEIIRNGNEYFSDKARYQLTEEKTMYALMYRYYDNNRDEKTAYLDVLPKIIGIFDSFEKANEKMRQNRKSMMDVAKNSGGVITDVYTPFKVEIEDASNSEWDMWIEKHTLNKNEMWSN